MSTRLHIVVSDELLARIDAAKGVGQPRADFIRRAIERALDALPVYAPASVHNALVEAARAGAVEQALSGEPPATPSAERDPVVPAASVAARSAAPAEQPEPYVFEAERQAVRAAVEAGATRARVEMGSALPVEQPRDETHWRPGSPEERLLGLRSRSSSQAKRDVRPVPKRGEKK